MPTLLALSASTACLFTMALLPCSAQTVVPPVIEYSQTADGQFMLTNDSLSTYVVVIEPRSFSIGKDGRDVFRPLDPDVHLKLSAMSMKLLPKQSYTVYYSVKTEKLPVWFSIYSTFSPTERHPGINVRIMLPHTVYIYQKTPLAKTAVHLTHPIYEPDHKLISFDIENVSHAYGRVREASAHAGRETLEMGGFPLLPDSPRHVEATWTGKEPPKQVRVHFDNFDLTQPIALQDATPSQDNPPASSPVQ